jgi:hypothetical protein
LSGRKLSCVRIVGGARFDDVEIIHNRRTGALAQLKGGLRRAAL